MAIAVIMMTVGCRTHKELQTETPEPVVEEKPAPERLDTIMNARYKYYSANFSCTVEGVKVTGQIRIVHDSMIWVSFSKVIELGRAVLTPTRVKGYAKVVNKYYDGDYATLSRRWGIDIDYATLEALLVGNCPPNCKREAEPIRGHDTVYLEYKQKSGATSKDRELSLVKNYKSKKLISTSMYSPTQNQRLRCTYSNTKDIEGRRLPATIGITLKNRSFDTNTKLSLEKITINQRESMPFSIPKRCKEL